MARRAPTRRALRTSSARAGALDGLGQRWGDPELDSYTGVFNTGYNVTENVELFGNGATTTTRPRAASSIAARCCPPQRNIAFLPRSTLMTEHGDGLPDPADQSLVNSIIAQGLDPSNYITPSASSPSGFVLLNPIYTQFPGGYSPIFGADITDISRSSGRGVNCRQRPELECSALR